MERSEKMKNADGILASGLWLGTGLVWDWGYGCFLLVSSGDGSRTSGIRS